MVKLKAISLFANAGIAETYFKELGIEVVLANELIEKRCDFYESLYPETEMIRGDITKKDIGDAIVKKAKEYGVNFVIATPPCQGMSTAGKNDPLDPRNQLIYYAVDIIKKVNPDFVLLENVPQQLKTKIHSNGDSLYVPEYVSKCLGNKYTFNDDSIINFKNVGVPQDRKRSIFLLVKKKYSIKWNFPEPINTVLTLKNAIGSLPILDPLIYDIPYEDHLKVFPDYEKRKNDALKISKWHKTPEHVYRQVYSMMYTPTGQTAFNNIPEHRPKKKNGDFVKGFKNTYKRQSWDRPGNTITTYNRTIGSQENVHPGRKLGKEKNGFAIYSDPRVLTIYEIMIVMSLPSNWNIPTWASDNLIRQVIGEGIPPVGLKNIMQNLIIGQ